MRLASKPGSTRDSSWKLRINKPAPASNTTDNATWMPTNSHCSEWRADTCVRRASRQAPLKLTRAARIAGTRPQSDVTATIAANV